MDLRYSEKATKIWNNLLLFFTLLSIWRQRKMELSIVGTCVLLLVCCTEWINKADFWIGKNWCLFWWCDFSIRAVGNHGARGAIVLIFLPNSKQNLIQLKSLCYCLPPSDFQTFRRPCQNYNCSNWWVDWAGTREFLAPFVDPKIGNCNKEKEGK